MSNQLAKRVPRDQRRSMLANRIVVGSVATVGAALLLASPVSASPLLHNGPVPVHTQSPAADAINKKYTDFGGASTPLGNPAGEVTPAGSGASRNYDGGVIYYSEPTGAHVTYGIILDKYRELGGPTGDFGFPTNDESDAPGGGRVSEFSAPGGAAIYWTPENGAWPVRGPLLAAYKQLGGPGGALGGPTAAQTEANGEYVQKFSGANGTAEVRWSQAGGFVTVPPELASQLANVQIPNAEGGALPDGAVKQPDGTYKLPDGTIVLADGSLKLADGSVVLPEGATRLPDGSLQYANGLVRKADGTFNPLPEGAVQQPDGSIKLADGTIAYPDGGTKLADGSFALPKPGAATGGTEAATPTTATSSNDNDDNGSSVWKWLLPLIIALVVIGLLWALWKFLRGRGGSRPTGSGPRLNGPDVKAPNVKAPEIKRPDIKTPEVKRPDIKAPEVKKPEGGFDLKKGAIGGAAAAGVAGAAGLGAKAKGAFDRDVDAPDVKTPDVKAPEVDKPDLSGGRHGFGDLGAPDVNAPKVDTPNIDTPDVKAPEAKAPEGDGGFDWKKGALGGVAAAGAAGVAGAAGLGGKIKGAFDRDSDKPDVDADGPDRSKLTGPSADDVKDAGKHELDGPDEKGTDGGRLDFDGGATGGSAAGSAGVGATGASGTADVGASSDLPKADIPKADAPSADVPKVDTPDTGSTSGVSGRHELTDSAAPEAKSSDDGGIDWKKGALGGAAAAGVAGAAGLGAKATGAFDKDADSDSAGAPAVTGTPVGTGSAPAEGAADVSGATSGSSDTGSADSAGAPAVTGTPIGTGSAPAEGAAPGTSPDTASTSATASSSDDGGVDWKKGALGGAAAAGVAGAAGLGAKATGAFDGGSSSATADSGAASSSGAAATAPSGAAGATAGGGNPPAWVNKKVVGTDSKLESLFDGLGGTDEINTTYAEVITSTASGAVAGQSFLVDENLSPKVAGLLRDAGYDAIHVHDANLRGGNNEQVLAKAKADGRTLITGELSYVDDLIGGDTGPSLLLLRRGGATIDEQGSVIASSLPHIASSLSAGALVALAADRIRARRLPLQRG
ncbi:DUF5615 family PIN-like protein [Antrihabitans cavernicola]|uniref:DUF5615 domain-containing protein n=1 Tax=Antrihabitans cavernicola TaxID=2495913 RepID=A0A5A7SJJ6_9NOCA|nr:DUF5615 family PIN-like protein [Spelaeibacter cavernicola]KAA0024595.1 hypothetical protein FOY51_01180 [Spelaeibacter cavernicola]